MEQFTVPQFIENEDKILGPITVRQFVIMLVAGGVLFVVYQITNIPLFILSFFLIGGVTALFAFYKVNGQPFHIFVLHVLGTVKDPSLRVWHKEVFAADLAAEHAAFEQMQRAEEKEASEMPVAKVPIGEQKLAELSLLVDTGGAYRGEDKPQ